MTDGLTFNTLRGANKARLPQFKNRHGALAHSKPDGSDWTPAQWLQATLGELGEFAEVRFSYEMGSITEEVYRANAPAELADVATYLDILAQRAFDQTDSSLSKELDPAQLLMLVALNLGKYADYRKKLDRGDLEQFQFEQHAHRHLTATIATLFSLRDGLGAVRQKERRITLAADPEGVNLGAAVMDKFNAVSDRVGSNVRLAADGWHNG